MRKKYVDALAPVFPFVADLTYEQARLAAGVLTEFPNLGPIGVPGAETDVIAASSFAVISRPSPGDHANIQLWMSHSAHERLRLPTSHHHGFVPNPPSEPVRSARETVEPPDGSLVVIRKADTGRPVAAYTRDDAAAAYAGYATREGIPTWLRWWPLCEDVGPSAWQEIHDGYHNSLYNIFVVDLPAST